jgi:uncharacterized protein (TIGR02996 family)
MTTEDDFQRQLDLHPDDHHTRMVLGDWLEEQGDPRGPGYRVLGVLRRCPNVGSHPCPFWVGMDDWRRIGAVLPRDWFDLIEFEGKVGTCCPHWSKNATATRRELEDAAASAFPKLPSERQRELSTTTG